MIEYFENPYAIKVVQSLGIAALVLILSKIALSVSRKKGKRTSETPYVIKYIALIALGIALIVIWLEGIAPLLTALTIVAAALTIVAKEMILNFLGSFVIFWRELFSIGDRVQVGDYTGDVIDKGILYFTLLESGRMQSTGHSTGRLVKIPNSLAHTLPIINATRGAGYVWNEIHFSITHQSDWKKGKEFLMGIAEDFMESESIDPQRVKESFERRKVYFSALTPKAYVSVSPKGIKLTLRYICRSRLIRESEDFITTRFLAGLEPGVMELSNVD